MPVQTMAEDVPAAVCFHLEPKGESLEVTVALLPQQNDPPYRIESGAPQFQDRDAFKRKVVEVGMTPAVAEDPGRSFNATARQLRELGFSVETQSE